ncbi:MAG TPA: PAS domain-containing protein [Longimicrobium sp.]|jgi:PAS domain S-box-containing protein|uniref:PAS domain-containing protein n=1 Tax=Longimicrobium sp. TaxID=2029185 RepID=UPI002EDA8872
MTTTDSPSAGAIPQDADHYRRQLETVAANATLALFILNERQRCTYLNPAAEALTGFTLAELRGKPLHEFIHHTRPDGSPYPLEECPIDRAFPRNMREQGEEVFVHKDGSFYPVAFTASPIRDGERTVGTIIEARGIADELRAREERALRAAESALIAAVGTRVTQGGPLNDVLRGCTDAVVEHLGVAAARIWTLSEAEPVLEPRAASGAVSAGDGAHGRVPVGTHRIGRIAHEGAPYLTNDVAGDERMADGEWAHREGIASFAGYPLLVEGHAVGVIALYARRPLPERTTETLAIIADGIALAIARARADEERERVVREMETQRARLAAVFQQAPAFIATLRGPDHVFELANPPYLQLVGHRAVVGKPVREALPEVAGQGFLELLDKVYRTGEPFVGNEIGIHLQRTPGAPMEERFVNFVYQPLTQADGRIGGILVHGVDVTDQLEARRLVEEQAIELETQKEALQQQASYLEDVQTELEASNGELQRANEDLRRARDKAALEGARLAAIIEHAPMGIIIAAAPSGQIVMGNRRLEEIFRHPVLHSAGVEDYGEWIAFHPDGRRVQGHEYPLARVFATGQVAGPDDYHYQRGDGSRAWVRITGAPIRDGEGVLTGGLVVIDDIDAERRAADEREQLIRDLEVGRARLEQIFSESPAVMALYAGPEHIITMVNPTWERTVGKLGAVGRPFREAFPEFRDSGLFELLDRTYESGEPYMDPEVNVPIDRWGTGILEDSYWNLVWRPLPGEGPHGRDILVHAVDVTEQVRARKEVELKAEELARSARALEASNRELDQFAYVASHDLKAPLRGISNLSSWIEEDLAGAATPEVKEQLALLRGRAVRMEALIDGILQYSRAGRVRAEAEAVDTGALVRDVVDLLAPPPGAAIEVAPALPVIVTERLPLQQVLMNLIGNAVKYGGGAQARVEVSASRAGPGTWEFAVRDHGPGIAPEFHDRIFTIFQTLESRDRVESTGIGLSIVKKLVEGRGGRVWVESAPGEGSTFRVLWPAESAAVE